jgi:hypothetical protein
MTSQSPRIYTYKITFEEVPYYYYGVKKEEYYNQEYWGSPKTNKWCWELYTPKKQILELFEYSDSGYIEAQKVEKRLITPVLNDVWCLNENVGGIISLKILRKSGKLQYENKKGVHARTPEQMIEDGKNGGKIGGKITKELGKGVHGRTPEKMIEDAKKGAKRAKELGVGVFGFSREELSKNAKKGASQKWMCLETGFTTNAGNLTKYQRAKGIDTSKRKRIK